MKMTFLHLLFLITFTSGLLAQTVPENRTKHFFACTDYTQGIVCIISDEGKLLWQYPAEYCNDLWVLPNGKLLFNKGKGVKEVTRDKKVVFEYESKSEIYACQRLANGNTLIACSDHNSEPRIVEMDKSGTIVWQITKNELPSIELKFMTGMEILPDGNLVFTNWLGHNQFGKAPHAFEITRDKQVVWVYNDHTLLKTMSNIQILEVNGNVLH